MNCSSNADFTRSNGARQNLCRPHWRCAWGTRSSRGQTILRKSFAQFKLVNFSRRSMRDFIYHLHVVGHPPFRNPAIEITENGVTLGMLAFLRDDDEQR